MEANLTGEQILWQLNNTSCSPLGPLEGGIPVSSVEIRSGWCVTDGPYLLATTIGDSPHDVVMLSRLLSTSSLSASRYRLLAASHGLSKRGKGPEALRSGVAVVGDDACCVCAAGDRAFLLGDRGPLVRATNMHAFSLNLTAMQGWRMAWADGGTRAWTLHSLRSSLCWVVLMSCRRDGSKTPQLYWRRHTALSCKARRLQWVS